MVSDGRAEDEEDLTLEMKDIVRLKRGDGDGDTLGAA